MIKEIDKRDTLRLKDQVSLAFVQAQAIATRIGFIFADEKKRKTSDVLKPWDAYPDLFRDEAELEQKTEEAENLNAQKAQMEAFAARWNAQRGANNV